MSVFSAAVGSPAQAQAQLAPERPYRGLFAGGVGDAEQSLVGTASVGIGYDTNVLAAALGRDRLLRPGSSGGLVQGSTGLNYTLARDRFQVGSSAGTSARYYPALTNAPLHTYNGSIGASARVLNRPAVTVDQTIQYRPFTFLGATPDPPQAPVGVSTLPDTGTVPVLEHFMSYQGGLGVSQPLSRRVSLSSNYQYRKADRRNRDFFTQGASAQLRVELAKGAGVYGGYRMNEGRYSQGRTFRNHSPVVGVDMARALSLTRQTIVSFGAGSTALQNQGRTQFRATGTASLVHQMGRTWQLSSSYARGLRYVETFDEPLFTDAVTVGVGGLINQRVQVSASVGGSKGQVGFGRNRPFTALSGGASLALALSRYSNLSVGYTHFQYNFDSGVALPDGVPSRFGRDGVTANVNLWVPLATKRRRP